ncbi:MAG: stage II sporulation protein M [Bacillota bacterium]
MNKPFRVILTERISNNRNAFLFLLAAFILGVSAGAFTVNGLSAMQRDELTDYLQGFLQLFSNQNVKSSDLLAIAFVDNMKLVGIIWILGVTIIGLPFIFIILCIRGFITGFSSGFIISAMGLKGVLFTALTLLPKEIIIVPCLIAIGVNGINFSMRIAKSKSPEQVQKPSMRSEFISYCFVTALFSCIILAGIIFDSYITPILIRIIAPVAG